MSDHRLTTAAAEGFKDSLQLANDLLVSIVRAPFDVVRAFVRHERRIGDEPPKRDEGSRRAASTRPGEAGR